MFYLILILLVSISAPNGCGTHRRRRQLKKAVLRRILNVNSPSPSFAMGVKRCSRYSSRLPGNTRTSIMSWSRRNLAMCRPIFPR